MIPGFKTLLQGRQARICIAFTITVFLGFTLYRITLSHLIVSILQREGSSHGVFVPFISALFLWTRREALKIIPLQTAVLPAALTLSASFVLLFIAGDNPAHTLHYISFFVMVAGVIVLFLGPKLFKEISFPLFFLMAMIPLPQPVYAHIAEWMRSLSTDGSTWLVRLLGVPFERDGYYIQLPNIKLHVGNSCSGIRYLISYFVFGLPYAFYYKKSFPGRALLVTATIPIAMAASIIRLVTIFLATYYIGPFMAGYYPHVILSWFVFAGILTGLIVMDRMVSGGPQG